MNKKCRVHDGIAGVVLTLGTWLGYTVDSTWLLVPGILGITLVQSAFTGFCPVYYILDKTCPFELIETLANSTRS